MSDSKLLNRYLDESGKTKTFISKRMGCSRPKLDKMLAKPETATFTQAENLADVLDIKKSDMRAIFTA